jgi:hypothetical protein
MRAILSKAVKAPSYLEALSRVNLQPYNLVGDEITTLTRSEIEQFGKVVRAAKPIPPTPPK